MAGDEPDDPDAPDGPEDRPELLSPNPNAASPKDQLKRENANQLLQRQMREFLQGALRDPGGRAFLWGILKDLGTFEEKYGEVGYGANREATWAYRGQKDIGLRLYHALSVQDRAGTLSLLDEFHPQFPKAK